MNPWLEAKETDGEEAEELFPCSSDPELFFSDAPREQQAAKLICSECSHKRECLQRAFSISPKPSGIWGGTTERERQRISRYLRASSNSAAS